MLRPVILGRLGKSGDQQVIDVARKLFRAYVDDGKELSPDLRGMVVHFLSYLGFLFVNHLSFVLDIWTRR